MFYAYLVEVLPLRMIFKESKLVGVLKFQLEIIYCNTVLFVGHCIEKKRLICILRIVIGIFQ